MPVESINELQKRLEEAVSQYGYNAEYGDILRDVISMSARMDVAVMTAQQKSRQPHKKESIWEDDTGEV